MKTHERIKQTGEVFTPRSLIEEMLAPLPANVWADPTKTWLEPAAGDGNFLVYIKAKLMDAGIPEKHILDNMLFSVELIDDNHFTLQYRLGYIDETGAPNSKLWSDEEIKQRFRIRAIHPMTQDLNKRNPYFERNENRKGWKVKRDQVICHQNHVCWTALEEKLAEGDLTLSFGRPDGWRPPKEKRVKTNSKFLVMTTKGDLSPSSYWIPDLGDTTFVENLLGEQLQLSHVKERSEKPKIPKKELVEKVVAKRVTSRTAQVLESKASEPTKLSAAEQIAKMKAMKQKLNPEQL